MSEVLNEYFEALERIKSGKPLRVPIGAKITNDSVSLEAGRGKGSIKRSRAIFSDLIAAVDAAAAVQSSQLDPNKEKLATAKTTVKQLERDLDAALAREISLLDEVYRLRKQLAALQGGKVLPIRRK